LRLWWIWNRCQPRTGCRETSTFDVEAWVTAGSHEGEQVPKHSDQVHGQEQSRGHCSSWFSESPRRRNIAISKRFTGFMLVSLIEVFKFIRNKNYRISLLILSRLWNQGR
jgi:hypothetical protein